MQYAMFIYEDETKYGEGKATPAAQAVIARHMAFSQSLGAQRTGGSGLKGTSSATVVRTSGGKQTVHDGPFAEAKEQLGGFYLIDAPDLDAALAIAKQIPLLGDGAIEVRPTLGPA